MSDGKAPKTCEVLEVKVVKAARLLEAIPEVQAAHKAANYEAAKQHEVAKVEAPSQGVNVLELSQFCQELVWSRLAQMGIYRDEQSHDILVSPSTKEGTARKHFCENGDPQVPEVRFAAMWQILNDDGCGPVLDDDIGTSQQSMTSLVQSVADGLKANRPIGQWSDEELLRVYSPMCQSAVVDELCRRSKNRPFVIFSNESEGVVDIQASARMLKEARKRSTPTIYKVADALKTLYKSGDFPSIVYHECPLHSGVLLLDGFCDQCGHSWEGVSDEVRQFARLVEEAGDAPLRGPSLRQFINDARQGGVDSIAQDYPQVKVEFDNLKAEDKLPSLKRRTATTDSADTTDAVDPMNTGKRRW